MIKQLEDIVAERIRQMDELGFTAEEDADKTYWNWYALVHNLTTPEQIVHSDARFRRRMVKIGALALAAIEQIDRKEPNATA